MKARTNVTIDEELLKKAHQSGLNVSDVLDSSLKKKFGGIETAIPKEDGEECAFCQRKFRKQTREDAETGKCDNTLIWLCPDEVWCCESCLRNRQARLVKVAVS